jgi:hypothetical protein
VPRPKPAAGTGKEVQMSVETGRGAPVVSSAEQRPTEDDYGYGWVVFAGVLLLVAGTLNTIYGIAAIDDAQFFVQDTEYVIASLNTWGWIMLCLGVAQVLVGLGVFAKNQFARWTGVFILSLSAVVQMLAISANPFLALAILGMTLLALYGLAAYGGKITRAI